MVRGREGGDERRKVGPPKFAMVWRRKKRVEGEEEKRQERTGQDGGTRVCSPLDFGILGPIFVKALKSYKFLQASN